MNVVELNRVTRHFGAVRAVGDLDLTIGRGSVVALLGPNGAGKTTALSLLLGLLEPDRGSVTLFGRPPSAAVRAGLIGAMPQDSGFVPGATVRDVVELARALYPHPLPAVDVLAAAGLTDRAGRRVDRLSGGETQRARFAFALAGGPELLVLDEPAAAMDVTARQAFWDGVRGYAEDGNTVLFSTHQLHEADAVADRIVVLAAGTVVADATPEQIREIGGGSLDAAFRTLTGSER
ncbi:putative ABC transporter ATP-binding protein [Actinoplanes missouriensis 431]|uniref:Putative ABC transporter ATP-binding protein n=1 Tax=Actinoplanes missouriensis (strain ATCC 14538 / DSM 43046 / CBS 188.64 / JCM 3121 / NBRC 102363 / NCIMB 12654 / NRRL B-3342 / UNCC 431) TaxID=512565 RepID=I0HA93_ACTM4|nr:ABC transporter ATP-binding protein [Actinoplanes missouriensis]BAL89930.1 putative ABC transporter ATP-binding protein [Actinoplanes missouriensis 431]